MLCLWGAMLIINNEIYFQLMMFLISIEYLNMFVENFKMFNITLTYKFGNAYK